MHMILRVFDLCSVYWALDWYWYVPALETGLCRPQALSVTFCGVFLINLMVDHHQQR